MPRVLFSLVLILSVSLLIIEAQNLKLSGDTAAIADYPYQVSIRDKRNPDGHICGGFLFKLNVAITAAQCVFRRPCWALEVYAGSADRSSGGTIIDVRRKVEHPWFNYYSRYADIAVLFLAGSFPANNMNFGTIEIGAVANQKNYVSGWGQTSSGNWILPRTLQQMEVTLIDDINCARWFNVDSSVVCGCPTSQNPIGTCRGDSGSPLVTVSMNNKKQVIGVVSFVKNDPCASGGPTAYTKLSFYQQWIQKVIS